MLKVVTGDLIADAIAGKYDVIVHGCNCFCRMGRGFALGVVHNFPEAVRADKQTAPGDKSKLGTCSTALCTFTDHHVHVVNAYTQFHWNKPENEVLVDYDAFRSCLQFVKKHVRKKRIGIPLIGAGLARGDWSIIERIILDELAGMDVTIVHYMND